MCKTLAGQGTYFWTLPMLGISTDPVNTVPEHVVIIHAFTNHEMKKEDCPDSPEVGLSARGLLPRVGSGRDMGMPRSLQWQGTGVQVLSHLFCLLHTHLFTLPTPLPTPLTSLHMQLHGRDAEERPARKRLVSSHTSRALSSSTCQPPRQKAHCCFPQQIKMFPLHWPPWSGAAER